MSAVQADNRTLGSHLRSTFGPSSPFLGAPIEIARCREPPWRVGSHRRGALDAPVRTSEQKTEEFREGEPSRPADTARILKRTGDKPMG